MSAPSPSPAGDSKSLATVLVPVAGVALIVVLVIVIGATSDSPTSTDKGKAGPAPAASTEKLTDGTDPNAEDSGLKDIGEGMKIRDLKEGSGPECPPGANVEMHYTGWLTNGTVFDSSRKSGKVLKMSLLQLIPGWQKGIPGMKVGGIRKLVIPPDLAYGPGGRPGIPPNATLVFEVELLGIK